MSQGYNFAPLMAGLESVRQQRNQNALMDYRQEQAAQQQQHQNKLLAMQQKRLDLASKPKQPQMPWFVGPGGKIHPAKLALVQAGRPTTNVNVKSGPQETAYDKEAGKGLYKEFAGYQKQGATANRAIQQLKLMEKAIADPNLYTGTGGQSVQFLKRAAATLFGANVKGLPSGEVVSNLGKTIALSFKDQLPGPMSNSDREFLVSIAPGLGKSKAGNLAIIKVGMAQRQYEADIARAAMQYAQRNGGRLDVGWYNVKGQLDQQYAQRFSGLMDEVRTATAGIQQPSPSAGIPNWLKGAPQSIISRFQSAPPGTVFKAPDGTAYTKE